MVWRPAERVWRLFGSGPGGAAWTASPPLVLLLVLLPAGAWAGSGERLARARAALAALELDHALYEAQQALKDGDSDRNGLVALYGTTGEIAASMGFPDLAVESFGKALELSGTFHLSTDASPRVTHPWEAARAKSAGVLLTTVQSRRLLANEVETRVATARDAFGLVHSLSLFVRRGAAFVPVVTRDASLSPRWRCDAGGCAYFVRLEDRDGNVLDLHGTPEAPLWLSAPSAPVAARRVWLRRPGPYFVVSAAALVAGGYCAYRYRHDEDALAKLESHAAEHTLREAQALDRSRTGAYQAMWGTAAAGVAAAAVGTAFSVF